MAISPVFIPPEPPKKGGGGIFSTITQGLSGLASLTGLAAAPFTGGASAALPAALLKTGAAAGAAATVGNLVDPVKSDMPGTPRYGVPIEQTAASQKLKQDPRAVVAQLNESISALGQSDERTRMALNPFLEEAKRRAMTPVGGI